MSKTRRLGLPYIMQGQAQKEVTHNQALNKLDVFVCPVIEAIIDEPPTTAKDGDIYIIGEQPADSFADHANKLAQYMSGSWTFYPPIEYMEVVILSEKQKFTFIEDKWMQLNSTNISSHKSNEANHNANKNYLKIEQWEEDLNLLGKVVTSKNIIPHHSMVIAVNVWVIDAITGAPSFAVGVKEDPSRYGDKLSIAKDTTNIGMTYHPVTYYYDTPITIMPNQMEFTGGVVRVSVQYLKPKGSWKW